MVKAERTKVPGQALGEVAGIGIRFNLKVTNASGSEINLVITVVVNAFYAPATPQPVTNADQTILAVLQQGASSTVATCSLPAGADILVELRFSLRDRLAPVAVFVGEVRSRRDRLIWQGRRRAAWCLTTDAACRG